MPSLPKKVPDITVRFWALKLLTTAMGEALSDYLVNTINPIYAVIGGAVAFILSLYIQLTARAYTPWKYWFAVSMVAVFGTMMADVFHIVLGVPYLVSSVVFGAALILIFVCWFRTEKTLSIHSVRTFRVELFYWLTVSATFALGTAVGDLTAATFGLGYLASGILFFVLILIPLFAYKRLGLQEVIAFWISYILTRPLGASFADWFGKSQEFGGMGFGSGLIAIMLIIGIVILTFIESRKRPSAHNAQQ